MEATPSSFFSSQKFLFLKSQIIAQVPDTICQQVSARCLNANIYAHISYQTYGMDLVSNFDEIVPASHEVLKPRRE
jgi:hypothetical protein